MVVGYRLGSTAPSTLTFEYFFRTDDSAANDRRAELQNRAVELLTQECMQTKGLPYVVASPSTSRRPSGFVGQLSPAEWASQYGFGITTEPPPELYTIADPNRAYADTLPRAKKDAYLAALGGSETTGAGCAERATTVLRQLRQSAIDRAKPVLETLDAELAADTRLADAEFDWTSCVGAAGGVPMRRREVQALVTSHFTSALAAVERLSPDRQSVELRKLQREEIDLAVAVIKCTDALQKQEQPVISAIQATWIEQNRDALDRLRSDLGEADAELEAGQLRLPAEPRPT